MWSHSPFGFGADQVSVSIAAVVSFLPGLVWLTSATRFRAHGDRGALRVPAVGSRNSLENTRRNESRPLPKPSRSRTTLSMLFHSDAIVRMMNMLHSEGERGRLRLP